MFTVIMVPVDLGHVDRMEKATSVAADIANLYGAEVHVVGVTQSSPTEIARTPEQYAEKLAAFAAKRSEALGTRFIPHSEISHDIRIDLDDVLERAAEAIRADLVVMSSHAPGFAEHIFSSNAGYLAGHSKISVLVLR